jgi:membrane-bound metal-dependent hydrolase YbcI (DUF457 family)
VSPFAHGLIAWLFAIALLSRTQDRRLAVIAGVAADIDGVFVLFSQEQFLAYHHTFGHSFVFGASVALVAAALATDRWRTGAAALGGFSLHLLVDFTTTTWPILPLYPLSGTALSSLDLIPSSVMEGVISPFGPLVALALAAVVMYVREVSPVEFVSERLDRRFVALLVYPLKRRCALCGRRALSPCGVCGRAICALHLRTFLRARCAECSPELVASG